MMSLNMESLFLVLSGVILAAGVLYWFWSHIQLTQKKVQLLENAVFELRGMLRPEGPSSSSGPSGPSGPSNSSSAPAESSGPASGPSDFTAAFASQAAYEDLPDDDNWSDGPVPLGSDAPRLQVSEDLQPGGRAIAPPSPLKELVVETVAEPAAEFRELFVNSASAPVDEPKVSNEALDAMPVKELRRLADQRGIQGTADMKKKEILSALRQLIVQAPIVKEEAQEAKEEVKTLDIVMEEVAVLE
jgi:hypothetical protein